MCDPKQFPTGSDDAARAIERAALAHRLNQPLAAIATAGEAALRWLQRPEPDTEEAVKLIERIVADANAAAAIVRAARMG